MRNRSKYRGMAIRLALQSASTLALSAALLWPRMVAAQTLDEQELEQGRPTSTASGWDATLGAGLAVRPRYDGADSHHVRLVPMGTISNGRGSFFAGPAGIGLSLVNLPGLRIGPVIGYLGGRKEDVDPHLTGLGDIPPALTAGVFATYRMGQFRLGSTVRQAIIHQGDGLYGNVTLDWIKPIPQRHMVFSIGPAIDFANGTYSRTFFGVTPQQSEQSGFVPPVTALLSGASSPSGLPPYSPSGGIKDVAVDAVLNYELSQHWLLRTFAGVQRLVGTDGNSPVVQDKFQDFIGVGLAYHFGSGPMPMGGAGRGGAALRP